MTIKVSKDQVDQDVPITTIFGTKQMTSEPKSATDNIDVKKKKMSIAAQKRKMFAQQKIKSSFLDSPKQKLFSKRSSSKLDSMHSNQISSG